MFETFKSTFDEDQREHVTVVEEAPKSDDLFVDLLLKSFSGKSFNQGLYRIVSAGALRRWNQRASAAFPSFAGRLTCFGVDWLGRVFALDSSRQIEGESGVVLLEPGTGEALQIPCNVRSFHEIELVSYREEALAESFYKAWRATGASGPSSNECIGYKRPLFLGGSDTVENLEVIGIDVYWEVAAQLLAQTRGVPIGTRIDNAIFR